MRAMTLPEAIKMLEQTDEAKPTIGFAAEHESKGKQARLVIMIKNHQHKTWFDF